MMEILEYGTPRLALFVCTWCGTVWRATTDEKGVYKVNMLGRAYPKMKCPLCSEKYVVGEFIVDGGADDEKA